MGRGRAAEQRIDHAVGIILARPAGELQVALLRQQMKFGRRYLHPTSADDFTLFCLSWRTISSADSGFGRNAFSADLQMQDNKNRHGQVLRQLHDLLLKGLDPAERGFNNGNVAMLHAGASVAVAICVVPLCDGAATSSPAFY